MVQVLYKLCGSTGRYHATITEFCEVIYYNYNNYTSLVRNTLYVYIHVLNRIGGTMKCYALSDPHEMCVAYLNKATFELHGIQLALQWLLC